MPPTHEEKTHCGTDGIDVPGSALPLGIESYEDSESATGNGRNFGTRYNSISRQPSEGPHQKFSPAQAQHPILKPHCSGK